LDNDYSAEAAVCVERNKIQDSQDTSQILYNIIIEELIKNPD
jgi:hypothetical protein